MTRANTAPLSVAGAATTDADHLPPKRKETIYEAIASFVSFFIYLLVLKSFFVQLFIIPTGSMAETLYGAHAIHTCPNCGREYPMNWPPTLSMPYPNPYFVHCPNCRWREQIGMPPGQAAADQTLPEPLREIAGDRIMVHGWIYDPPFTAIPGMAPQRWDVVVFKVPSDGQTNYIKRLIGLPNETIEIIDGDVYADEKICTKTPDAQRSLWMPYYQHDFRPRQPSSSSSYHPRFVPVGGPAVAWKDVDTRAIRYDGEQAERGELLFVTDLGAANKPGEISDIYAYNGPLRHYPPSWRRAIVSDTRLTAEIVLAAGDGYVELGTTKYDDAFYARLYADGRLRLEHAPLGGDTGGTRETWAERTITPPRTPTRVALFVVDHQVGVEVGGERVMLSTPEQYSVSIEEARARHPRPPTPRLTLAAERVRAELRHIEIDRDVHYLSDTREPNRPPVPLALGVIGKPAKLGPDAYFVCGDNSPASLDSRFVFSDQELKLNPQLQQRRNEGRYQPGTIAADQMIGRAFFVYWPGFLPLFQTSNPRVPNIVLDVGRSRWIR